MSSNLLQQNYSKLKILENERFINYLLILEKLKQRNKEK